MTTKKNNTNKHELHRHPLAIALVSGVILAVIGHYLQRLDFEHRRSLQINEAEIRRTEAYLDEYVIAIFDYYATVENWILDSKEKIKLLKEGNDVQKVTDRLLIEVQQVNHMRSPLYAAIEKTRTLGLFEDDKPIKEMYTHIIKATTLVHIGSEKSTKDLRTLLDEKFFPTHWEIIAGYQKRLSEMQE